MSAMTTCTQEFPAHKAINIFCNGLLRDKTPYPRLLVKDLIELLIVPLPQKMFNCTYEDIALIAHCAHVYNESPISAFNFFTITINNMENNSNIKVEEAIDNIMSM